MTVIDKIEYKLGDRVLHFYCVVFIVLSSVFITGFWIGISYSMWVGNLVIYTPIVIFGFIYCLLEVSHREEDPESQSLVN